MEETGRPLESPVLLLDDGVPRRGALNMAIDDVLLESLDQPLIRFYRWSGDWISFGYFKKVSEVEKLFPDPALNWVRRRTGGGIVDHRSDLTYSVLLPRSEPLAGERGPASYAAIHSALSQALDRAGVKVAGLASTKDNGDARCFANPVRHDIVDIAGVKLAGAGQHRGRAGLLHQGSIQNCKPLNGWKESFAAALAERVESFGEMSGELLRSAGRLADSRYSQSRWMNRR